MALGPGDGRACDAQGMKALDLGFSHDSSHASAGSTEPTHSLKLHTSSDGARPAADGKDELRQREALGVPSEKSILGSVAGGFCNPEAHSCDRRGAVRFLH